MGNQALCIQALELHRALPITPVAPIEILVVGVLGRDLQQIGTKGLIRQRGEQFMHVDVLIPARGWEAMTKLQTKRMRSHSNSPLTVSSMSLTSNSRGRPVEA